MLKLMQSIFNGVNDVIVIIPLDTCEKDTKPLKHMKSFIRGPENTSTYLRFPDSWVNVLEFWSTGLYLLAWYI